MVRKYTQDQRGYVLVLSLVVMLFGTLVVGSLFTYIGASLNTRAIARDNLNAYYAADAGMQVIIAKLIQADYRDADDKLAPLPYRFDDDNPGQMDPDEYYVPSDLFPDASPSLSDEINGYEARMTVKHLDMCLDYVEYEITAYAFEPGASNFGEAKDKITAIVRQAPNPMVNPGAMTYWAFIISWQRQ